MVTAIAAQAEAAVKGALAIIGWSVFLALVVLGLAALVLEWQVLEGMLGL